MKKIHCVILSISLAASFCWSASQESLAKFASLRVLDFPLPFCASTTQIDVAGDHFVEIENDLPGRDEFNELIRFYQKKNWFDLASAIKVFRAKYESSALIEAIEFLELQADLEQISDKNDSAISQVEKKFRSALLLYPRSTFAPVAHASLANYFLRTGSFSKAQGIYRAAREQYPFHSTACIHLFGEAEANFFSGNFDESDRGYQSVIQKCQSTRLQVAAQIRRIDIRRENGESVQKIEKDYERVNTESPTQVSRYHPELLFNLGELKYRNRIFSSSTFYFNEFSRNVPEAHSCQPALQKRIADLSKHNKKSPPDIIGQYLSVYEKYPRTDLGRFSRVHALLLSFNSISEAELKRRMELINSELNLMRDSKLKDYTAIEKGLALLERKDETGLDFLQPLKNRLVNIFRGELDTYIRKLVLDHARGPFPELGQLSEKAKDRKVLEPLERVYPDWFLKTPDAEKAELAYRYLVMMRFDDSLSSGNVKGALAKLERWKASELFQKKWVDSKTRWKTASGIAIWWLGEKAPANRAFAKYFLEKREAFSEFFLPEGEALLALAYLELNDISGLEESLKRIETNRSVAQIKTKENALSSSAFSLILGRAARATGNLKQSEIYLAQVIHPQFEFDGTREKIQTWIAAGKTKFAIEVGLKKVGRRKPDQEKELLLSLRDAVLQGKQWTESNRVFQAARKLLGDNQELVPFWTMEGKALLEQKKWKESNEMYSQAVKIDPAAKNVAETRFNIARCLSELKNVEGAKKEWQEVVTLKDEFWSPLAANELKLLEKP